ncbi:unnamed protein product [Allacma fusca]|uniref:RRM domain-containing protein n=1 Tax=Allacma fusca TaxID=39272 RepID=A0A8J2J688_9HEXA|nr:unnamed protein product [Allacma fusca]
MSSKKNKKNKGTTLSLQDFNQLLDDKKLGSGQNVVYAPKKKEMSSWADEVEDDDAFVYEKEKIYLPSAPRASRGPAVDDSQIPREAPYTAHLGNLSYDIGEEDVYKFFRNLNIIELRLPRDGNSNRLRGFGYVEFETRQDLVNALIRHEEMLKGRQVRISLGQQQNRNDGDRRGGDRGGDRGGFRSDDTPDDWRSTMKTRGSYDDLSSAGGGSSNFERRREGPREDRRYMDRPPRPDRGDREGRRDYDRGYRGGSYEEEEVGGPDDWRSSMRPQQREEMHRPQYSSGPSFERNPSEDRERRGPPPDDEPEQREPEPPRERKKLVIAPRTVPNPPGANSPDAGNAAIFGGAKPVDTAARERQIEEKLAQLNVAPSPPPPQRERTRDRHESESERDRSHEEPQQYRILKRPSSERTTGEADNVHSELSKPSSQQQRRSQTSPRTHGVDNTKPKIITANRSDRERVMSTSSVSSRGSNPDSSQSHYAHPQPLNGQRSVVNHNSGGPSPHYPVPPAPGASQFHRHKSDSDDGDHEDSRNSRHERQRDEPSAPPTNAWSNRRHADHDNYHSRQEGPDRKTPDSDRNGEKEKDSHSEPEDDRDTHRFIVEKEYIKDGEDGSFRGAGRDRDYRGPRDRNDRDRDRDRDDSFRRGGAWNNNGPRRGDGGPRRTGGFQDDRRGVGRDDRDRGMHDRERDRDLDRRDLRDTRRPSADRGDRDRDRDRDFRTGGSGRMDRGNGSGGGYNDRGSRGQGLSRRGGAPLDKGLRGPPGRMNSRESEFYRDNDGFEVRGPSGRDRPMPKHLEEKPALVAGTNKFSFLTSGDQSD